MKFSIQDFFSKCEQIRKKLNPSGQLHIHWRSSGVFIVNLEHISHLVLVFLLLINRIYYIMKIGRLFSHATEKNLIL